MLKTRIAIFIVAGTAALAVAAPAFGQSSSSTASGFTDPTTAQYANDLVKGTQSAGGSSGGGVAGTSAAGQSSGGSGLGSLPFTGWDLLALGSIAVCLLATGFLLMSLSRPRRND